MKKMIMAVFLLPALQSASQTAVMPGHAYTFNAGGGSKIIDGGQIIEWSIGESTIIETFFGLKSFAGSVDELRWNVTSGILQPHNNFSRLFNTGIPSWTNEEIGLYPVPTPAIVNIDFRPLISGMVSIQLHAETGKLLGVRKIICDKHRLTEKWDLSKLASATYYLRIVLRSSTGELLKAGTFKVIKQNIK
jgi:hypothetical protein